MKISPELLQVIINYLTEQPFRGVVQILNAIDTEIKAQQPSPEAETTNEPK